MTAPRRWKFAIVFWVPYTALILLYQHYPWVDTIWMGLSLFAVLALSVHLVVKKYRRGGDERIHPRSPLGYPHWLMHFYGTMTSKRRKASIVESLAGRRSDGATVHSINVSSGLFFTTLDRIMATPD